jgi:beta-lactamase regulating signal transducer with metallopeptidase domain/thiol-disulfide isomerase/thioredoxin
MNTPWAAFFEWLPRSSGQAAVLTVLVLLVQFSLGKRLDGRWRHLLWFLVVARLLLPWSPPSPASVYNYLRIERHPASAAAALPAANLPAPTEVPRSSAPSLSPTLELPLPLPVTLASLPASAPATTLAPQPRWMLPRWPVLLAAAWAAGVAILLARLIVQNYRFRRRLRSAPAPADQGLLQLFEDCHVAMGVSSRLRLVQTGLVATPALYGLFRLRLLLPPDLAARFSPAELRHIFLHELSHVRRRDMLVQWLITGLRIIHWFNPVLWFAFRRMAADRELACDELALSAVAEGESPAYGRTIVKLLEYHAGGSALPGLVGILEDKDQIFRRVTMIAAFKRHSRWSILGAASAAVLGLATLTGAQTQESAQTNGPGLLLPGEITKDTKDTKDARDMNAIDQRVAAIVSDWENLPNVFQDVEVYSGQIRELVRIGKPAVPSLCAALDHTDHDPSLRLLGFTLRAIGDPRAVSALIRAVPKTLRPPGSDCGLRMADSDLLAFMRSNDLDSNLKAGDPLRDPTDFAMGRPVREIGGALAKITGTHVDEEAIYSLFLDGGEAQRAAAREAYYQVASRWADWWKANGHRLVPEAAEAEVPLSPPPRATTPSRFPVGPNVRVTEGMEGMVLAPVASGQNCGLAPALTRFYNLPPQLAATNGNVSLENISVWAAKAGVDLLGAQYRDPQAGKSYYALRGAGLQAWEIPNDRWSTIETSLQRDDLPALDSPAGDLLMHYDLASASYAPQKKATFLFITRNGLQGMLRVTGQVTRKMTQADRGNPYSPPDESDPNQTSDFGQFLGVKFDYKLFYEETEQMRSEEKARQAAARAADDNRQQSGLAALLDSNPRINGTILAPDGQPAANTAILISRDGESATLANGHFADPEQSTITHTHADGSVTLPRMLHGRALVADESGFATIDFDQTTNSFSIRLAPWGRIEGTATLNGKLAPHEKIVLLEAGFLYCPAPQPYLHLHSEAEADDQGRFIISNVPAGEAKLYREVAQGKFPNAVTEFVAEEVVDIVAGQTNFFRYGLNGRVIKGHLTTSDASEIGDWRKGLQVDFMSKSFFIEVPANEDAKTWPAKYWESPAGKAASRSSYHFAILVESNGDFHIDDVPPGTYRLQAFLHDGSQVAPGFPVFGGKTLGQLKEDVVIPEHIDSPANSPLDLGNFVMQMKTVVKSGDPAPDFGVKTVTGETLRLADFRGKYVLLDFWATWCGPCRGETPNLKSVYDAHGSNPKFAMLSLSLDKTPEAPLAYAKTNGMNWAQGFLGEWSQATLPARYGADGIPAIFLLDPAGKIVATDLRGEQIERTVRQALAER